MQFLTDLPNRENFQLEFGPSRHCLPWVQASTHSSQLPQERETGQRGSDTVHSGQHRDVRTEGPSQSAAPIAVSHMPDGPLLFALKNSNHLRHFSQHKGLYNFHKWAEQ